MPNLSDLLAREDHVLLQIGKVMKASSSLDRSLFELLALMLRTDISAAILTWDAIPGLPARLKLIGSLVGLRHCELASEWRNLKKAIEKSVRTRNAAAHGLIAHISPDIETGMRIFPAHDRYTAGKDPNGVPVNLGELRKCESDLVKLTSRVMRFSYHARGLKFPPDESS